MDEITEQVLAYRRMDLLVGRRWTARKRKLERMSQATALMNGRLTLKVVDVDESFKELKEEKTNKEGGSFAK